ncbi:MAG: hypothetical protein RMN25_05945 [Anaerolineae bacterium]|nr:hypothetical protein [Thermoflexales bacterium]MDW8407308.1 hypothetical protein [Anaerolineae bacterium]
MTQSDFRRWVESILGDMPFEEIVSKEVLEHINRLQLMTEDNAWRFAHEESRESFVLTIRAMCKTMFAIGYDAGREQAKIDALFGEGSGLNTPDEDDSSRNGLAPL